jgi:hypothetical protein
MTDLETLTAMFNRAGIPYTLALESSITTVTVYADPAILGENRRPPNDGYVSFYTEYKFDEAGALTSTGVWE